MRTRPPRGHGLDSPALTPVHVDIDPYLNDPLQWGASMAQHASLLLGCLDVVQARSVAEGGAFAGDLTRMLVQWAQQSGGRVVAIDPSPQDQLVALAAEHEVLELVRETSLHALREIELPEVVIIDGDHNYYTESEELRASAAAVSRRQLAPRSPRRLLRCRANPAAAAPSSGR